MKTMQIFNFPISVGKYQDYIEYIMQSASNGSSQYIYVANVHMVVEAFWNKSFNEKVRHAGLVTPDGKPLTWALRLLHGIKQDRVAGMDILPALLKQSEKSQTPVYIYGGTDDLLSRTRHYLDRKYPDICIKGLYSPPFRELTPEEEDRTVERINSSGAKLLFVVLGCPKQEQWMASMAGRINAVMIGIGGALPVLIGMQKRAPKWMQDAGLEWLFRFLQEPRRLFKRYFVTNSVFLYLLSRELVHRTFTKKFENHEMN
ncbi:WecB/TagA/CpsF family glycosyltransferase [Puia sp.]|jgi:N-acetylglucosaminyldiphosphoundecaprenol N-acetyl-beta-D-mannosaminyltransferase|uniref:WecB/TagA/CpsF family glycosyltransferase n=1 Tax=Puia sp. TaxID=2045100 RepID=UPI002F3EF856